HREVQDRLTSIFELMLEKRTVAKVVRALRERQLRIPRQDHWGELHWRQPTTAMIGQILSNPAYAGAFAFGRTSMTLSSGVAKPDRKRRAPEDWKAFVPGKFPFYVSWENFEKISAMLADNRDEFKRRMSRGVPRDGKALLQGVVYCGHCGRK